jgi:hypothetical protein
MTQEMIDLLLRSLRESKLTIKLTLRAMAVAKPMRPFWCNARCPAQGPSHLTFHGWRTQILLQGARR